MKFFIVLFSIVALLGLAWFLFTQADILLEIKFPMNILDKEAVSEWFAKKQQELSELIGYEPGAIHKG